MNEHCGFYWVDEGRLAGSAYPAKCLEWMYARQGIRAILSLEPLTSDDAVKARNLGMQVYSVSIQDFTAGTPDQRIKVLRLIDQLLKQGLPTLVHCKGGLGRTGMILALYLIKHKGLKPDIAIEQIRELREGSIEPGTGQEEVIHSAEKGQ